jgi:hypothetical protein
MDRPVSCNEVRLAKGDHEDPILFTIYLKIKSLQDMARIPPNN